MKNESQKFQNRFRIPSTRVPWWNYGENAAYYVTLCTQDRICWFGDVVDKIMRLSNAGMVADQCWRAIPDHFPFVLLGEYVVMPNHVHGIIHINKPTYTGTDTGGPNIVGTSVETQNLASLQSSDDATGFFGYPGYSVYQTYQSEPQPRPKNKFAPQSENLGSILRGFKVGVKKGLKSIHPTFGWQGRFHDHIIRSEEEYHRITMYIRNNPANWNDDPFNKK